MLYLIGMSQLAAVLRAYAGEGFAMDERDLLAVHPDDHHCWLNLYQNTARQHSQAATMLLPVRLQSFDLVDMGSGGMQIRFPEKLIPFLAAYREALAQVPSPVVFASIGGAEDIHVSIPRHEVPFDFVLPEHPAIPVVPDWQIVSPELVARHLRPKVEGVVSIYIGLRAFMPTARFVHIMAPPTKQDDEFFYSRIMPVDETARSKLGIRFGVNPASFRLKAYLLYCQLLRGALSKVGVESLDAPHESVNTEGYLLPEYYHDSAHANTRYGALVLDQIENLLASGGA